MEKWVSIALYDGYNDTIVREKVVRDLKENRLKTVREFTRDIKLGHYWIDIVTFAR